MIFSLMTFGSLVYVDQIEQRKEKNPDNINEVPVETRQLNRRVVNGRVSAPVGFNEDDADEHDADGQVDRMNARHRDVEEEEDLRLLRVRARVIERETGKLCVLIVVVILNSFDNHEDRAQDDRQGESDE